MNRIADPMPAASVAMQMPRAAATSPAASRRRGELALALQEAFTVAVRLRTRRQVAASADAFRAHVKQLLATADQHARGAGYDPDLIRLSIYAYIAFLDESVLNSQQPMFAAWPRQPLQEEIFGEHVAGENFFRHLGDLMGRMDGEDVADAIEVYELCLLLGFRGKYAANPGAVDGALSAVREKLVRIRGGQVALSPAWSLPEGEKLNRGRDRWLPRLAIASVVLLLVAIGIYLLFRQRLGAGVDELGTLVTQIAR